MWKMRLGDNLVEELGKNGLAKNALLNVNNGDCICPNADSCISTAEAVILYEDTLNDIENIFGSVPNFMKFSQKKYLLGIGLCGKWLET
jgi:hypothetical protein